MVKFGYETNGYDFCALFFQQPKGAIYKNSGNFNLNYS